MQNELAFLGLRGTFLLPELQEQALQHRIGNGRILHAIPVDREHVLIHTATTFSLRLLSTQTILWEIDCPSSHFALNCQHNLLMLSPENSNSTIVLWDLRTGQFLRQLTHENRSDGFQTNCLELNKDGTTLAVGIANEDESMVVLWDTTDGHLIRVLPLDDSFDAITTLAFHPNGNLLAGGSSENHCVWFWNLDDGHLLTIWDLVLSKIPECPHDMIFNLDGTLLFVGWGKWGLRIWDVRQQQEVAAPTNDLPASLLAIDPGGRYLVVAYALNAIVHRGFEPHPGGVRILEIGSWQLVHEFTGTAYTIPCFSPDGQWLATTEQMMELVRIRRVATWQEAGQMKLNILLGTPAELPPAKQFLASERLMNSLFVLWHIEDGKYHFWRVEDCSLHRGSSPSEREIAFSPDGTLFAAVRNSYKPKRFCLQVWRVANSKFLATLDGHKLHITCLACSPDGQLLASGSADNTVRFWNLKKMREVRCSNGHTMAVQNVAFAPDGTMLASCSLDKTIHLWRVKDGKQLYELAGHDKGVTTIAFSPSGQILASVDEDGVICLWEVATRKLIRHLFGYKEKASNLAFSPDGRFLASGSAIVSLWNTTDGQELYRLKTYQGYVSRIAFLTDGVTLLTVGKNCARFWSVEALIKPDLE